MGALSQKDVGDYLNKYFVSSYQKISNFVISGGAKQGGNVASYFCLPNGRVLHAAVGPVSGAKLLEEARWVEETWKLAEMLEIQDFPTLQVLFRKAHLDRLNKEFGYSFTPSSLPVLEPATAFVPIQGPKAQLLLSLASDQQAKVHLLLAAYPLPKIGRIYNTVFETILNQKISTAPVVTKG